MKQLCAYMSSPVAQCIVWRAPVCSNAYGGWFMPRPRHCVRLTYRPSAALRLLGSLRISHNKFLWFNKGILILLILIYLYINFGNFFMYAVYKLVNTVVDVNECLDSPCSHGCENSKGSYTCLCEDGYTLDTDDKTCIGIYLIYTSSVSVLKVTLSCKIIAHKI